VLADVPDPRRAQGQLYKLPHVLLFAILAIVTGCNSYRGVVTFIDVRDGWGNSDRSLTAIIHEKCAIKAKPLIPFTTMRMGCLMKFFAMKSLAQVFGGLGRFRAVR